MTMEFKFSSNIFKNSPEDQQRLYGDKYDPNKNYPIFTGTASIPKKELAVLVEYFNGALLTELKHDEFFDDVVVPIKISGWQAVSERTGRKYLSLTYTPDYKTLMAAREAKEAAEIAAHRSTIDQDASKLAAATGGSVVPMQQEDIF